MPTVSFLHRQDLSSLRRLLSDEEGGQDLIEYAMLAGLIAIIAIGAVTAVGTQVNAILWAPAAASF